MQTHTTITIRNLPVAVQKKLKKLAADGKRSFNSQAVEALEAYAEHGPAMYSRQREAIAQLDLIRAKSAPRKANASSLVDDMREMRGYDD